MRQVLSLVTAPCAMLLVCSLAACGGSVPSPSPSSGTTATVQGQLTDAATGEAIIGARIAVGSRQAVTDSAGHYELSGVPATSSGTVARDYQATITLTGVTAPVNMSDPSVAPRYPDHKFTMPLTPPSGTTSTSHDFKVGKLSANIVGVVGTSALLPVGGATIELQDNTAGMVGTLIRKTTSDTVTGRYTFSNVEAGVDYLLVGRSADGTLQGNVTTGKLADNQTLFLTLSGKGTLLLSNTDTYSPRIIAVSPENNADVAPGNIDVVFTFNEPIKQDSYSTPNPSVVDNIYYDVNVSYGGKKAAGNYAHTLSWNATFDALTVSLPATGASSKFTVDLTALSPASGGTPLGKLMDLAGNKLENSPVLTSGHLLSFSTNGGVPAQPPVILSPDAGALDRNAVSVNLDWQPAVGATKGYNVYRSTRSITLATAEPFVRIAGPITPSNYADTQSSSGFNLLPSPEVAQYYVYRVTSINSDLIESAPSNEITAKDVIQPSPVGTSGVCVAPGGTSLTILNPVTTSANGQVQFTFSEPMDVVSAETVANYTGTNISAAKLTSPTTVVLDFSVPIVCVATNFVRLGTGITDVAGNPLAGTVSQRTLTYVP